MVDDTSHRVTQTGPTGAYSGPLIEPAEVRAGIARELHALADLGLSEADALIRAVEVTAGKIRNSRVLIEHQAHHGRCHACDDALDDTRPVVAVMQAHPGRHLWFHGDGCHDAYRARRTALVDRIMASAGYGGALTTGEAA